ncbi:phage holin family protein [Peptostreptococcus faecalis]|uniref:phage holin family protein n=1 Tax=Peptostreptococcus faecalis TaxID=2045015 RepID=UPI001A9A5224|nr:phage holin family protein [Peptostreptococcus faecalis]
MIDFIKYIDMGTLVFCLVVGFMIKNILPINNKYIPLILGIIGAVACSVISKDISIDIITMGAISGLASTGLHQTFRQFIDNPTNKTIKFDQALYEKNIAENSFEEDGGLSEEDKKMLDSMKG